jgi:hypothetical protein
MISLLREQTMRHFHDEWIQEWCDNHGWTELFRERYNHYWAFPPGAVMPEPIPSKALRVIKSEKGLSSDEQLWLIIALIISISAIALSYFLLCPMPIVFAFAFDAITCAQLEVEGI